MPVAETTVICLDNSTFILSRDKEEKTYETQWEAIKYYCETKFNAHPGNDVVVFSMGTYSIRFLLWPPTRDLHKILNCYPRTYVDPDRLKFQEAVKYAGNGFGWPTSLKKKNRMLLFVGGPTDVSDKDAVFLGNYLKKMGIAVDVVNFHLEKEDPKKLHPNKYGWGQVEAFVKSVNHKNNSHIEHVKPGVPIREVLSKSILKETLRLSKK